MYGCGLQFDLCGCSVSTLIAVSFSKDSPSTYPSLAPTFVTFKAIATNTDVTPPGITQLAATGIYWFLYGVTTPTYFLLDGITVNTATDRYVFGVLDPAQQVDLQLNRMSTTLSAENTTLVAMATTLTALGTTNVALGTTNFGLGTTGVALGATSVALGLLNFGLGQSNIALGNTNVAIGITGLALGTTNVALGTTNVALGTTTVALGITNVAIGTTITSMVGLGNSLITDISARIGTTASSFGTTAVDPGDVFGFLKRAQEFREGDQSFSKTSGIWAISTRGGTLLIEKSLSQTSTNVSKS